MASYVDSQPKQFTKYTPTIDSQVYGQLLAKDDTEYQAGVQKVNSYLGAVAGLPVASEEERQYLQGLVNGVTSQVNQMVGNNYSDQKVVGNIATMAGSIYGDEKVQKAVSNAATAKRLISDIQEDEERTKGQNAANKYVGLQRLNQWRSGHTLGSTFDATYDNYTDAHKVIEDMWTKKHPDQKIRIESGYTIGKDGKPVLDISKWDEVKHTWKGLRQDEVASEISDFIQSNPNIDNQLTINSKYKYRNYGAQNFLVDKKITEEASIRDNNRLVQKYLDDRAKVPLYSEDYNAYTKRIDEINMDSKKRQDYISNGLYQDAFTFAKNPAIRDQYLDNMYRANFVSALSNFYSYGEDNIEFIGESPSKKYFESERLKAENRRLTDQEQMNNWTKKMEWLKYQSTDALNKAKIAKLTASTGSTDGLPAPDATMGIPTSEENKLGAYEQTKQNLIASNNDLIGKQNAFMYNMLGKYADKYFTFDENNNPIPKAPEVDANGNITKDYKKELDGLYNQYKQRYTKGDPTLDQVTKDHFTATEEGEYQRKLTLDKIERNEKAWDEETKNNPAIRDLYQRINNLNKNPQTIKSNDNTRNISVTGNMVMGYESIKDKIAAIDEKMKSYQGPIDALKLTTAQGVQDYQTLQQQKANLFKQAGISPEDFYELSSKGSYWTVMKGDVGHIVAGVNDLPQNKTSFLDKRMQGSQVYTAQQARGLFGTDKKYNEDIRHRAINIVTARDGEAKVLGDALNKFNISATQDPITKKYFLLLQDPTGKKKVDPVEISDYEASSLGMKDIVTVDPVLTRLSLNDDRGLGANTGDPDGTMSFDNSFKAVTTQDKGIPVEYRYGVTRNQTGWYVTLFKKNLKTGEVSTETMPRTSSWPEAKGALNKAIGVQNKVRQTYSYDATIDNNVNRNADPGIENEDTE